jgi:hypothetical protein
MTKPKIDLGLGDLDAFEPTERGGGRTPPVPAAERQAIDATAREHGFTKTSIPTVLPRRARRGASEPMHQLNIRGPVSVIARFIAYCDDERLAYWEALDRLMKNDDR